ncbi:hypothetical protein C8J57DRAFT_1217178 [Mycena rebaudengoi]|nr:hypothetical protein C8J57DRAFT_1217178 [Mycena rebaudengoi]
MSGYSGISKARKTCAPSRHRKTYDEQWRAYTANVVQAAARITAPRVMLGMLDSKQPLRDTIQSYYQMELQRASVVASYEHSAAEQSDYEMDEVQGEGEQNLEDEVSGEEYYTSGENEVYLSIPKRRVSFAPNPQAHNADQTRPVTRATRQAQAFDSIQVPTREEIRNRPNRQIIKKGTEELTPITTQQRPNI